MWKMVKRSIRLRRFTLYLDESQITKDRFWYFVWNNLRQLRLDEGYISKTFPPTIEPLNQRQVSDTTLLYIKVDMTERDKCLVGLVFKRAAPGRIRLFG